MKTKNYAHIHVFTKCVTSLSGFMCFVLILVFTLSLVSGEAPFLTGEEPSGELKHALTQAGGPTQSQLSRPVSSRHNISMEHRPRRKQLNSDADAKKKKNIFFTKGKKRRTRSKKKKRKSRKKKGKKKEEKKRKRGLKGTLPETGRKIVFF